MPSPDTGSYYQWWRAFRGSCNETDVLSPVLGELCMRRMRGQIGRARHHWTLLDVGAGDGRVLLGALRWLRNRGIALPSHIHLVDPLPCVVQARQGLEREFTESQVIHFRGTLANYYSYSAESDGPVLAIASHSAYYLNLIDLEQLMDRCSLGVGVIVNAPQSPFAQIQQTVNVPFFDECRRVYEWLEANAQVQGSASINIRISPGGSPQQRVWTERALSLMALTDVSALTQDHRHQLMAILRQHGDGAENYVSKLSILWCGAGMAPSFGSLLFP